MAKNNLIGDTFEQLAELGSSTAKKSVQQVVQTLTPAGLINSTSNNEKTDSSNPSNYLNKPETQIKGKDHTPVNFHKLQDTYKDQEKIKLAGMRDRLFRIVKNEEERSFEMGKMIKTEKKRKDEFEIQTINQKKKDNENQHSAELPTGRTRKSIFSRKKNTDRQHAEIKPDSGKQ